MVFIAIFAALAALIIVQNLIYKKKGLKKLKYKAEFGTSEAFCGDNVYMYESLSNEKKLPLPYVKVNTDLKNGLAFTIIEERDGKRYINETSSIQSIFVMKGNASIRRRWRVICKKRGVYYPPHSLLLVSDLFGFETTTGSSSAETPRLQKQEKQEKKEEKEKPEKPEKQENRQETQKHSAVHVEEESLSAQTSEMPFVVLPSAIDLSSDFISSANMSGDVINNHYPITDPVRICGSREYTPFDPMNRINWKSTAVHSQLMVNVEERTVRHKFGVILNMNSRPIEKDAEIPGDTEAIEQCITVCASILDRAASRDIPVRLYANTSKSALFNETISDDIQGSKILVTPFVTGKSEILGLLRILAYIEMQISLPADDMFEHICSNPQLYSECQTLVIVSAYLDGHITHLHSIMKKRGINVMVYLTTGRTDASSLPDGMEIYYKKA